MKTKLLLLTILFTTNIFAQFFVLDESTIKEEGIENILITTVHKGKEQINKYYQFDKVTGLIKSSYRFSNYFKGENISPKDVIVDATIYSYDKSGSNILKTMNYEFRLFPTNGGYGRVLPSGGKARCKSYDGNDTINSFSIDFSQLGLGIKTIKTVVKDSKRYEYHSIYKYNEISLSDLVKTIEVKNLSFKGGDYNYKFYYNSSFVNDSLLREKTKEKRNNGLRHNQRLFPFEKVVSANTLYKVNEIKYYDSMRPQVIENFNNYLEVFDSFCVQKGREQTYLFNYDFEFLYYYMFLFKNTRFDDEYMKFSYAVKANCTTDFLLNGKLGFMHSFDTITAKLYSDDEYILRKGGRNKFEVIKKSSKDKKEEKINYNLYYSFIED